MVLVPAGVSDWSQKRKRKKKVGNMHMRILDIKMDLGQLSTFGGKFALTLIVVASGLDLMGVIMSQQARAG